MLNEKNLFYIYNGKTHSIKYKYNTYIKVIKEIYEFIKKSIF